MVESSNKMRYFIALEIPEENNAQLAQVQQDLKRIIPNLRLINPGKFHLTIAFVGEQPETLTPKLEETMLKAVTGVKPFSVTPAYIDGFPNLHTAHIIWAGVKGDIDQLFILQERIKDNLVGLNLSVDERRFVPHIALAKIRDFHITIVQESSIQEVMNQSFNPIEVSSIKLFESVPDKGLHTHNTLAEIKLV